MKLEKERIIRKKKLKSKKMRQGITKTRKKHLVWK